VKRSYWLVLPALLVLTAVEATAQCDGISWSYHDPILTIRHDTEYNCAVFDFSHSVLLQGDVLVVHEYAVASGWADCICPYYTTVQIGGLPPGAYTLRYEYGENVVGEPPAWWTWCELPLVIPGASCHEPDVIMVSSAAEGCGIVTSVPDPDESGAATWSTVKAMYR